MSCHGCVAGLGEETRLGNSANISNPNWRLISLAPIEAAYVHAADEAMWVVVVAMGNWSLEIRPGK